MNIPDIINTIILGIVEGITEMLPVSSTGHLIIFNQWFSFSKSFTELFDVFIQAGAILAVLFYFRRTIFPFGKGRPIQFPKLWWNTIVAILPILILGYLFGHKITALLFNPTVVACALIVNGILLIGVERVVEKRAPRLKELESLSLSDSLKIGLFQLFALIPGMSRSASTMIGGLLIGVEKQTVAQFSFIIAIPTILIASAYALLSYKEAILSHEYFLLLLGFMVSLLVCYMTVRWFFGFLSKFGLAPFGYYRIVLGIIILIFI